MNLKTGGDWVVDGDYIVGAVKAERYNGQGGLIIADVSPQTEYQVPPPPERAANAAFIVTSCNNHYRLLEALEALVNKVEQLSLWDKTDSSYYQAKALINNIKTNQ